MLWESWFNISDCAGLSVLFCWFSYYSLMLLFLIISEEVGKPANQTGSLVFVAGLLVRVSISQEFGTNWCLMRGNAPAPTSLNSILIPFNLNLKRINWILIKSRSEKSYKEPHFQLKNRQKMLKNIQKILRLILLVLSYFYTKVLPLRFISFLLYNCTILSWATYSVQTTDQSSRAEFKVWVLGVDYL